MFIGVSAKAEAGIVHLDVTDEEGVRSAFDSIQSVAGGIPVLVCEMVKGSREVIVEGKPVVVDALFVR